MAEKNFSAQIADWIRDNEQLCDAVIRQATQETIEIAQVSRQKGGNMPVVTGFLRASGRLSLTGFPTGPDRPAKDASGAYAPNDGQITAVLAGAKAGNILYFAWSAVYARRMNYKYGFLDKAAQQWPQTVDKIVKRLKKP